ncbi:MAG: cell envelope integrity EipB family protein [Alphaproteobacteria bacterium]|nr:cell envelope integrity EipB family protein [Alphaproteobacteria bacterium]
MKRNFFQPVLILSIVVTGVLPAQAVSLVSHRAVYDISLVEAEDATSISDVSGRMVFELTGSECDGYAVQYRFVTRLGEKDGTSAVTDFRVTTFEEADGSSFSFASSNFVNNNKIDEVRGVANRKDDEITVGLTVPEEEDMTFPGSAVFPSQQFEKLINAAIDGQKIVQHLVFDGSEKGKEVFDATSLIGARGSLSESDKDSLLSIEELAKSPFWPVTISYFDLGATGELLPNYVTSFDMHDNGISRNITMDYGDMVLKADLTQLDVLDASSCN